VASLCESRSDGPAAPLMLGGELLGDTTRFPLNCTRAWSWGREEFPADSGKRRQHERNRPPAPANPAVSNAREDPFLARMLAVSSLAHGP